MIHLSSSKLSVLKTKVYQGMSWSDIICNLLSDNNDETQCIIKLTSMHRSNICRIESGRQNISIDTLIRIFDALGMDISIELKDKLSD